MQIFQSGHNQAWPGGYFLQKVLSNMHDIIRRVATVIAQQSTMMDGTGVGMVSSKFHELDEEG